MQSLRSVGVQSVRPQRQPPSPPPKMSRKTPPLNRLTLALAAAAMASILAASGCLMHPEQDELTKGVVAGERPVAMEGRDSFFAGKLGVKVTLSRGIGGGLKKGRGDKGKDYSAYAENSDRMLIGSPLPPVTLHLIVTNNGAEAVTVKLVDFDSDLGNFAMDPETLTIEPGKSAEPTTMVSSLGVTSDEIPFKVTLRIGTAKDSRTIKVRNIRVDSSGN